MIADSSLFHPIQVGASQLKHRVVLAPLSRNRCDEDHVPTDLNIEYYTQRATPGGLLIAEATVISSTSHSFACAPAIHNDAQVQGWKKLVDAVHAKHAVIYLQLWHVGRATSASLNGGHLPVAASAIPISGINSLTGAPFEVPHALTVDEIKDIVKDYAHAAQNAMKAGFDGVEIHAANGYLPDTFINTSSNKRTDAYGGPIENRVRFPLEIVDAVVEAIGAERTAIRLSPWSEFQDMEDATPYDTWGYIIQQLQENHPKLAYIHMIEPRDDYGRKTKNDTVNTLDPFRAIWKGVFMSAGGYTTKPQLAAKIADETGNLIAIGRAFLANPDLVERLKNGWELNKYNRDTFYFYPSKPEGYIDYPFYHGNN